MAHFWVLRINYKCDLTLVTWGLVLFYPFLGGGFCAFSFIITFFFPLLLNAHVATYLYCITNVLLNKCAWDLLWKGSKFIILNSCSSSVPMKLGFFCDHPLWPPSPTYRSFKRHKCLTKERLWVALPVQGKVWGKNQVSLLWGPPLPCGWLWECATLLLNNLWEILPFPFSKCMETGECFHISAHLNFLCSTCYQNISLLNSSVGSESMLGLIKHIQDQQDTAPRYFHCWAK